MTRFFDTPELFGVGMGSATYGNVACQLCGTSHTGREDDVGEPLQGTTPIRLTNFAGITVLECCFGRIEDEVLERMPSIVPWFVGVIRTECAVLEDQSDLISRVREALMREEEDYASSSDKVN